MFGRFHLNSLEPPTFSVVFFIAPQQSRIFFSLRYKIKATAFIQKEGSGDERKRIAANSFLSILGNQSD